MIYQKPYTTFIKGTILVNEFGTTDNFLLGKKSRNTTKSLGEKRGRVAKVCEFFLDSVHIY